MLLDTNELKKSSQKSNKRKKKGRGGATFCTAQDVILKTDFFSWKILNSLLCTHGQQPEISMRKRSSSFVNNRFLWRQGTDITHLLTQTIFPLHPGANLWNFSPFLHLLIKWELPVLRVSSYTPWGVYVNVWKLKIISAWNFPFTKLHCLFYLVHRSLSLFFFIIIILISLC